MLYACPHNENPKKSSAVVQIQTLIKYNKYVCVCKVVFLSDKTAELMLLLL